MRPSLRLLSLLPLLSLLTGCANYEFDLLEPKDLARHIAQKEPTTFVRDDLEYRLQAAEGRLVMRINNPTDDSIDLVGEQSTVVDPKAQSRPIRGQTIAPHSFIKVILPPLRPLNQGDATWGIGVSVNAWQSNSPADNTPWPAPRYMSAADNGDYYWDWSDQDTIRLRLTYRRNDKGLHHEFTIKRIKT